MSSIHEFILRSGSYHVRKQMSLADRRFVDASAAAIAEPSRNTGLTHPAWCGASFPRRQVPNGQSWTSHGPRYSITVEPGLRIVDGNLEPDGVPFGSRIRLIMMYVQTVAAHRHSTKVLLCTTLNSCMQEMGLAVGGHSYVLMREQIRRFISCRITVQDDHVPEVARAEQLSNRSLLLKDHDALPASASSPITVTLGDDYLISLEREAVAFWQPALKLLANQSLSIDAYLWLAHVLPRIQAPTTVTWPTLHRQFGPSFKNLFQFRPRFISAAKMAIAVYREADIDICVSNGIVLRPSAPPVIGDSTAWGCGAAASALPKRAS